MGLSFCCIPAPHEKTLPFRCGRGPIKKGRLRGLFLFFMHGLHYFFFFFALAFFFAAILHPFVKVWYGWALRPALFKRGFLRLSVYN